MPRRNLLLILAVAAVSLACYKCTNHDPYGRYFADIMNKVDRLYVEPVDQEKLFDSAVNGMLETLDPHSEFMGPIESRDFAALIDQRYGGVGIEVSLDDHTKKLTVIGTIVGSPAYESKVLAGDLILKIDGHAAEDLTVEKASDLIRGPVGTNVKLTLGRAEQKMPLELTLARAEIKVDSVLGDTRNADDSWNFRLAGHPEFAYIRIRSFGEHTADELRAALKSLGGEKIAGLILDLRFNPGGRLDAAVEVCSQFIPPGQIVVTTRGRDKKVAEEERSIGPGTYTDFPIAVLVNSGSASASEIVSACLQDYHRAVIVGHRTYGKGTVQRVLPVEDNRSILKLTTATYWRPSNKNIHRGKDAKDTDEWGVMPDDGFALDLTKDETEKMFKQRAERDVVHRAQAVAQPSSSASTKAADKTAEPYIDPQLQRAIEYLQHPAGREKDRKEKVGVQPFRLPAAG